MLPRRRMIFWLVKIAAELLSSFSHEPFIGDLGVQSAGKWKPQSQPMLVANLQDLVTGRDARRERQIHEARESPQRFMDDPRRQPGRCLH